jgi:2-dehydro-3-deoxygluconokinase
LTQAGRIVSFGEAMVEMASLGDSKFRLGFAGDTLNTAWYLRQLLPGSWQVDYATAFGDDLYSRQALAFLTASGLGTSHVQVKPGLRPGLYLIHQADGDRHFTYWRDSSAARRMMDDPTPIAAAMAEASVIYFSGITLAILPPPARDAFLALLSDARAQGVTIAFDPNIRLTLWQSGHELKRYLDGAVSVSDIVFPTFQDEASLFGDATPTATADRCLALGVRLAVVKDGAGAALIATPTERLSVSAQRVDNVVDATGAGDSFNAGFLAAYLQGQSLDASGHAAHALAAYVIGYPGALIQPVR